MSWLCVGCMDGRPRIVPGIAAGGSGHDGPAGPFVPCEDVNPTGRVELPQEAAHGSLVRHRMARTQI